VASEDKAERAVAARAHGQEEAAGGAWAMVGLAAGLAVLALGLVAPASFMEHFTVFVLACFVGWQVVWNVKPALHTPLMSVTNAVSGIILIGGMLQLGGAPGSAKVILGALAVLLATVNIAGGFLVTGRMLAMFRR
jgi:NAD(P) transhydrogenase subunit alpha